MRSRVRTAFLPAAACAALLVPGCGGSELPPDHAQALVRDLDRVEQGAQAGECAATRPTLRRLQRNVSRVDEEVRPELRTTLDAGVRHLRRLFADQCREKPDPVVAEPEPVAPTPVEPTPTPTPTPSATEPTPDDSEQKEPKETGEDSPDSSSGRQSDDASVDPPRRSRRPKLKGDGRDPCPPGAAGVC